jgi:hypothetical protein
MKGKGRKEKKRKERWTNILALLADIFILHLVF